MLLLLLGGSPLRLLGGRPLRLLGGSPLLLLPDTYGGPLLLLLSTGAAAWLLFDPEITDAPAFEIGLYRS